MIMDSMGRGNFLGGGKNNMVEGEDRLEVEMHRMCVKIRNGVDSGYNSRMTFFEEIFHAIGTGDLRGTCSDALELILLFLLLEFHG
jgi:hypothetical protein